MKNKRMKRIMRQTRRLRRNCIVIIFVSILFSRLHIPIGDLSPGITDSEAVELNHYPAPEETNEYSFNEIEYDNNMGLSSWEELSKLESSTELPILTDEPLSEEIQVYLFEKSIEYDLPFELLMSIIRQESSYKYDALSPDGSYGLMQVRYTNHDWLESEIGVTDFYDPYQNIDGGMFILDHYRNTYNPETYHQLLMMYNAGPNAAKRLFKSGIYSSQYSREIINRAIEFGM